MNTQTGTKVCPNCLAHNVITARICQCGYQFSQQTVAVQPRRRGLSPDMLLCLVFVVLAFGGTGYWMYIDHDKKVNPQKYLPDLRPPLGQKGIAKPIEEHIMKYAYDPASVQIIECSPLQGAEQGGAYTQDVVIRAKNGFGALIVTTTRYIVTKTKVISQKVLD